MGRQVLSLSPNLPRMTRKINKQVSRGFEQASRGSLQGEPALRAQLQSDLAFRSLNEDLFLPR